MRGLCVPLRAPFYQRRAEAGWGPGAAVAGPVWLTSPVGPQDYCGHNSSLGSFSIITENVPCGTTGVTCSKAIKIFMGVSAA